MCLVIKIFVLFVCRLLYKFDHVIWVIHSFVSSYESRVIGIKELAEFFDFILAGHH